MESITNPAEKFKLAAFYKELDEYIAIFGAEATLMNIEDGVMAVLRYKVASKPVITLLTQHTNKNFYGAVHLITISSQRQIDDLKAALTQSYV